jgi:hypothetical protein
MYQKEQLLMRKRVSWFALLLFVLSCAHADQLYVRNRPFKGATNRTEGKLWVELKPLVEALGLTVQGDDQSGYWVSRDPAATAPGPGKVFVEGTEIECSSGPPICVPLDTVAPLLGARVVVNQDMGTTDVSLAPAKNAVPAGSPLLSAPYNLVEYNYPEEQFAKDIQPALNQAKEEFKNVQFVLCNLHGPAAALMKVKPTKDKSYPEVVLVDGQGNVLFSLRGNHVIANGLIKQLRKHVKR